MAVKITLKTDGPLKIEGPIEIVKADGTPVAVKGEVNELCRCGQSANKPFCDSSHRKAGFKAP